MSNGRKTANATASGECFCNTVTGSIAVENPKVVSVEWVDERGDKATTVKYGVPVSLRVTTEDGPRCSIILYVQCDGWRQEYVSITRVAARDVPYATEETTITFTPDAGWLNPSGSASGDITATVFLVWNKDQLGQGDEAMLRGFVQGFKGGSIGLREFWRFRAPVFFDFKEAEVMKITKAFIIFPLLIKPHNDTGSDEWPNRNWRNAAGGNSATYNSIRSAGRRHAGRDLYGKENETVVVAICDGVVLERRLFYDKTDQISILHTTLDGRKFIVRYGEVAPTSINVAVGQKVVQGQEIAKVGKLDPPAILDGKAVNMLHFEYYTGLEGYEITDKPLTDNNPPNNFKRRADIADPIEILVEGYENTFNK